MLQFSLSQKRGHGVSCDASGAFIGFIPLLERRDILGKRIWEARDCDKLSAEVSVRYGVPIDLSSRAAGLKAVAKALNDGDIARAQFATLFLQSSTPPRLTKCASVRDAMQKFAGELQASHLLKTWEPEEHPRWPAGAPDSQGGQFAPKGGIQVAENSSGSPICHASAAAGCIAGVTATAPEAAATGCLATGPGCPAGGAVGGAVTSIGACIAGAAAADEACRSISPTKTGRPSNPDRPSDKAIRDQCIQNCHQLLERPAGKGRWDANQWDFRRCLEECIREKKGLLG